MVLNCTVFPLDVWTDIICDVLASAAIGVSIVPTDAKSNMMVAVLRCFLILCFAFTVSGVGF